MNHTYRRAGFTMMEFVLVVSLSSILVLGMGVVIEMPRQMVERRDGGATESTALVSVDQLEKDIRFAADVVVPDPKRLEIHPKSGPVIEWAWDGVIGGVLTRTDASGSVTLLKNVRTLAFDIETATLERDPEESAIDSADVEVASWSAFQLLAGYYFGLGGGRAVTVSTTTERVAAGTSVGFFFQPTGLAGDVGLPTQLTARLRRNGSASLNVAVYLADATTRQPDLARGAIAKATLRSGSLPVAMSNLSIPMTAVQAVSEGRSFLAVLTSGDGGTSCCDVERHALSLASAAAPATTSLLVNSGGRWGTPGSLTFDSSQSPFGFQAQTKQVVDGTGGARQVTVPIAVRLSMALVDQGGTKQLKTSFPVENNLCLLNQ